MANMIEYLQWRGDLNFSQSPFNEVDNLLLAYVSYTCLDGIVPGVESSASITIAEASELFFQKYEEEAIRAERKFTKMAAFVMQEMAKTKRFQDAKLSKYVNQVDVEKEEQFSAIYIEIGDGTTYLSYRGTDDTVVGWKEDFNMSVKVVPAQEAAVAYLEKTAGDIEGNIRLGGHSKGGNLAIYAGSQCKEELKPKIIGIYNNDGPGFQKSFIKSENYQGVLGRIKTYVPESSVVGMLLAHSREHIIVGSTQKGFMQHDPMSWEILGNSFIHKDSLKKESEVLDETIAKWLDELEEEEREEFVNNLFAVLEATGVETLSQIGEGGLKNIAIMLKKASELDSKTKDAIVYLVKMLLGEWTELI